MRVPPTASDERDLEQTQEPQESDATEQEILLSSAGVAVAARSSGTCWRPPRFRARRRPRRRRRPSRRRPLDTNLATTSKPIILYVNQGNGVVNGSNFGELLSTATSHGFNTIFFQVYRSGVAALHEHLAEPVRHLGPRPRPEDLLRPLLHEHHPDHPHLRLLRRRRWDKPRHVDAPRRRPDDAIRPPVSSGYSGKTAITTTDPTSR